MAERALMPDYLRLVALFGIVVVNVGYMAFPIQEGFPGASVQGTVGDIAAFLVNGLALLKTYGLFSFMFGVGLAFQIRSAERRELAFGPLYRNRMIGLVLLGLAHGCLFFSGDILVLYAMLGTVLYLMRNWPVRRLVWVGAALLAVQLPVAIAVLAVSPDPSPDVAELEQQVMTGDSFLQVAVFRTIGFAISLSTGLFYQGIAAMGWFCLGLAAMRSGMIDTPDHPLWTRARRLCLLPGVVLSLTAAAIWQWYDPLLGEGLVVVFAPLATLGYLGLIAALARPPGPMMARVLTAGGSSLSVYLGQSLVLSTIFSGYGFGLWDGVGPAMAVLIALAVTAGLILGLMLWRLWFRLGPFEWVLRRITQAGQPAATHGTGR